MMVLVVLALLCFALSAFGVQVWRFNLTAAGLALLTLGLLFSVSP